MKLSGFRSSTQCDLQDTRGNKIRHTYEGTDRHSIINQPSIHPSHPSQQTNFHTARLASQLPAQSVSQASKPKAESSCKLHSNYTILIRGHFVLKRRKNSRKSFRFQVSTFFSLAAAAAVASDDGHDGMLAIALAMRWLEACFVDLYLVLLYVGCSAFTILRLGLVILN